MGVNEYIQAGHNIRDVRLQKSIKQKDMASLMGVTVSTYANYEADRREMPAELIAKAAGLLDVPIYKLIGVQGSAMNMQAFLEHIRKCCNLSLDGAVGAVYEADAELLSSLMAFVEGIAASLLYLRQSFPNDKSEDSKKIIKMVAWLGCEVKALDEAYLKTFGKPRLDPPEHDFEKEQNDGR